MPKITIEIEPKNPITLAQFAVLMDCSEQTIRNRVAAAEDGIPQPLRIGDRICKPPLFSGAQVLEYVARARSPKK